MPKRVSNNFRFVGYLEEEACAQYTLMLEAIDEGKIENVAAPEIARKYWNLHPEARLRDVVLVR
jgi:ubiquinol oxidase